MTVLEILSTEKRKMLLIDALEAKIKKAKAMAEQPMQGYSTVKHQMKVEKWKTIADDYQDLLDNFLLEMN